MKNKNAIIIAGAALLVVLIGIIVAAISIQISDNLPEGTGSSEVVGNFGDNDQSIEDILPQ